MEYQHGGDVYSHIVQLDYSANLNPLGMPERVRKKVMEGVGSQACVRYPDSQCRSLRSAIGRHLGIQDSWVICGNGAADLIFGLAAAIKPRRVLIPAPAFAEYQQAVEAFGGMVDHIGLLEHSMELPVSLMCRQIWKAFQEGKPYDMVFFCNPNNPTGLPVSREEGRQLAEACGKWGAFLVADECFCDFLDRPEDFSLIPDLYRFPHLFILKAFTKMYSMAGLRLGYGLSGNGPLLEKLCQVRQPWSVSGLAQLAGEAALEETDFEEQTRKTVKEERWFLSNELEKMGFFVYPSQANYLFFKDPWEKGPWEREDEKKGRLYKALLEQGILIRSCANYQGLDPSYYRICVKLRPDNERFIEAVRAFREENICQNPL